MNNVVLSLNVTVSTFVNRQIVNIYCEINVFFRIDYFYTKFKLNT